MSIHSITRLAVVTKNAHALGTGTKQYRNLIMDQFMPLYWWEVLACNPLREGLL